MTTVTFLSDETRYCGCQKIYTHFLLVIVLTRMSFDTIIKERRAIFFDWSFIRHIITTEGGNNENQARVHQEGNRTIR